MTLWAQHPDILFPAPDDRHTHPTLEEDSRFPSATPSLVGAGGRQGPLSEPPAVHPELLQQLVTCCFWKSRVQGPGREAGWVCRRESTNCSAGPSLTPQQAQISTPEVTPASLGAQIATVFFPSVKSNQNQHMFVDICQVLNK